MSAKLPSCLSGAGALGHTWVVTRYGSAPGEHNTESILGQCSYGSDAARMLDEQGGPGGEIYSRSGRMGSKWKRTSRAAALLEQNPDYPYEPAVQP